MEVIDDDDDYNEGDDGDDSDDDDNDNGQDQGKKKHIKKAPGKPVPLHLQNLKRSYCECGRSYLRGSDLKRHKLKECGKTGRVCPNCQAKFMRCQSCREHYYEVHLKKESYKCEVCNMKFFHNPHYTEHKKEHPKHTFSKKVWDDNL